MTRNICLTMEAKIIPKTDSRKTRHCDGKNYHFCLKQLLCSNNSAVKKNKHRINIENENE